MAPREQKSGAFTGKARLTGQGRPALRLAAWRGLWGTLRVNPVYTTRFRYLITREENRLTPPQAHAAIAAAILRQLHAVVVTRQPWNPDIATRGTRAVAVATTSTAA